MDPLSIISLTLPTIRTLEALSEQLNAIGGTPPYTWTLVSGSLPTGVTLSASGVLGAVLGAIPATAAGTYPVRIRVADSVLAQVERDYSIDVLPSQFVRVSEYLVDPKLEALANQNLIDVITRTKLERHHFRNGLAALGQTFVHLDQDIKCLNWAGSDRALRDVLDLLKASIDVAIKTINSIGPDLAGDFDIVPGAGLTITPQPNGIRLDVIPGSAGGVDEYNSEVDLPPWSPASMAVPSLPDVAETWIQNNLGTEWDRVSEQSHRIAKFISPPPPVPNSKMWSCALGEDTVGGTPHLFKVYLDAGTGSYIVEKYDALTLALIAQLPLPLGGMIPYGEPLIMQCPSAPKTLIVCGVVSPGLDPPVAGCNLIYHEIDPDGVMALWNTSVFAPAGFDPAALGVHPNYDEAYDSTHWRLYGTFINDPMSPTGMSFVVALKLQYGAINQSEPTLVTFPVTGGVGPVIPMAAVRLGSVDADTLDVSLDPGAVPNSVLWVVADFRWTNAGAASMFIYKLTPPVAAITWTTPLPAAIAAPVPFFALLVDTVATDGMEFAKAKMAIDAATRNSLSVVYVKDVFLGPATLVFPFFSGPVMHQPRLQYQVVQNINGAGAVVVPGGVINDEQVVLETGSEGEFGRWWNAGGVSLVYYVDPKQSSDRAYVRRSLFDASGPVGTTEDILSLPIQGAVPSMGILRPAVGEFGLLDISPRASLYLSPILVLEPHAVVQAIDSPVRPSSFRTYYDGANVVFENNTPFSWHVKMEALINQAGAQAPMNLMIPCWMLAQGIQNFWNANAFYPSASCNPPGPGGVQGTVWDENELGLTPTAGQIFFPGYYSVAPGTWDLNSGSVAQAWYYSTQAAGIASDQWLVFRYNAMPASILAAEAVMAAVIGAAIPAPGVYTLAQIDAAMGMGGAWVAAYSGSPFDLYQYFCFVDASSLTYYHGWFSLNYIHNAQVYGPAPGGASSLTPFIEHFVMTADAIPGNPTTFTLSRHCVFAEVMVNGIEYWQGIDWTFGLTTNIIDYLNNLAPAGYPLHNGDRVSIKYIA